MHETHLTLTLVELECSTMNVRRKKKKETGVIVVLFFCRFFFSCFKAISVFTLLLCVSLLGTNGGTRLFCVHTGVGVVVSLGAESETEPLTTYSGRRARIPNEKPETTATPSDGRIVHDVHFFFPPGKLPKEFVKLSKEEKLINITKLFFFFFVWKRRDARLIFWRRCFHLFFFFFFFSKWPKHNFIGSRCRRFQSTWDRKRFASSLFGVFHVSWTEGRTTTTSGDGGKRKNYGHTSSSCLWAEFRCGVELTFQTSRHTDWN